MMIVRFTGRFCRILWTKSNCWTCAVRKNNMASISNDDSSDGEEVLNRPIVTRRELSKKDQLRSLVEERKRKYDGMSLSDRRRLYKCGDTFISPDQKERVVAWNTTGRYHLRENVAEPLKEINERFNDQICIFNGDITKLEIDAIVNAANERCLGGGGVDGAIHRAAGSELLDECHLLDGCPTGSAKITYGYKLPAKHVIHAVGPRGKKPEVLTAAYQTCMDLVKEHQLKTVAFPCISTGIFGYPNKSAAVTVSKFLRKWLETDEYAKEIDKIILCIFLDKDFQAYLSESALPAYFPFAVK